MKKQRSLLFRIIRGTIIGIVCSISIISCSSNYFKYKKLHDNIDISLDAYRKKVYAISKGKLGQKDTSIGFIPFSEKNSRLLGRCTLILPTFQKEVDIVKTNWYYLSEKGRLLLMAHELIHCECDYLKHNNRKLRDGCPADIMNQYSIDNKCIDKYLDLYLSQIKRACDN